MKTGQKSQICHYCGVSEAAFKNKRLYQEHYKEHLNETFSCDICHKSYTTSVKLKNHKRFTHESPVFCDICKVSYSNKQNLKKI